MPAKREDVGKRVYDCELSRVEDEEWRDRAKEHPDACSVALPLSASLDAEAEGSVGICAVVRVRERERLQERKWNR